MKKRNLVLACLTSLGLVCGLTSCETVDNVKNNIQNHADNFSVYRKMTFINLYSDKILYTAEGYFSVQTTVDNNYQGQQELGLVFKTGPSEYKMDYFSIANNVTYVIEQTKNTTTDPYHWEINWFITIPENHIG